ncbi:MAG TPA: hypothetical protein VK809_00415 [Bacteroidia bacterium]|jgi:hypothetical protein|nr:hypothetical protein [Bacteroidia bacterium]
MSPNERGIFPAWVDDDDIISELLKKMLSDEKALPYSFVINPEQGSTTQERMRKILDRMEKEKLIILPQQEFGNIELGVYGSTAGLIGYKAHKRQKHLSLLSSKVTVIFFRVMLIGACAGLLYLLLHSFKII